MTNTPTTMDLEKCARAAGLAEFHGWNLERVFRVASSEDGDTFDQVAFDEILQAVTRAVLSALLPPSPDMVSAGALEVDLDSRASACFKAMISSVMGSGE